MKYLSPFLLKKTLLDTPILLISIFFFIEIGSLRSLNFCFWISISPNFLTFSVFIYAFKNLYFLNLQFPNFFLL